MNILHDFCSNIVLKSFQTDFLKKFLYTTILFKSRFRFGTKLILEELGRIELGVYSCRIRSLFV